MIKSQIPIAQSFGEFFRSKRISIGLTLRSFCERFGLDPAYISRIERELLSPPQDRERLEGLAKALGIKDGTSEWVTFFDMAYIAKGQVPEDILKDKQYTKYLPLLFRTARGQKLSSKKLQDLVDLINKK